MGRHTKVLEKDNFDKRELGYYYTPDFIASYISKRVMKLHPNGEKVLDPCVGQEELLEEFFNHRKEVDGMDVFSYKSDYTCHFKQKDFITYYADKQQQAQSESQIKATIDYDYFIANPPYNCHEVNYIRDNKKALQELFKDVGVHNMYSMFISAMIDLAKEGAMIGLITYDSFFTAKAHTNLRKKILAECTIHEITMCPNDLFHEQDADVRTSIVILQKGKQFQQDVVVHNRPFSSKDFKAQLDLQLINQTTTYPLESIILHGKKDNLEFIIDCPDDIRRLFSNQRIQDEFKCITGISTGNDRLYISKEKKGDFSIPFYKNPGKNRFYTDNFLYLHEDFLTFDKEIKNFLVRNKSLLFKPGISCSSMGVQFTACRLPVNVTYGVNANIICEDDDAWWLLAYLNSELVSYLVRGILIRSNMITSGYVARIPLLSMTKSDKDVLANLAYDAYELAKKKKPYEQQLTEINDIIHDVANISQQTIKTIKTFNQHIIQNT